MSQLPDDGGTTHYTAREVVGVFPTSDALEFAVKELEIAGVDRAAISVLGVSAQRSSGIDSLYKSAEAVADDPAARRRAFASSDSVNEGKAFAIAIPAQVGGFAGAWAVVAAGGAMAVAIGATIAGGVVGAGVAALLVRAVARHHADEIHAELKSGGLVLWVSTPDDAAEHRALEILQRSGGKSVHAHGVVRNWGTADVPLHDFQPDPFLERDK
jgi:outer membrane lipoprotein SlyB